MFIHTFVACFDKHDKKLKNKQNIYSMKLFKLGIESTKTAHDPDKVIFNMKLFNLGIESTKAAHDPEKVIFNCPSHVLTESKNTTFCYSA